MKKIIALALTVLIFQGLTMAQKQKAIAEKDVKVNYVKDFQRQVKDATQVNWWLVDSVTYKVTFLDNEKSRQAMLFSNKGTETHYYVDSKYYPAAIRDTVANRYPKCKIEDVWVRKVRGKMTYQASVVRYKGFLWFKKLAEARLLNFEIDGKFIGE